MTDDIQPDDILLIDTTDRVRTITLNRPQARNALSSALRSAFFAALRDAEADTGVDVVIVTGADPVFCAGLDLKELGDTTELPDISPKWPPMGTPVIGAINGAAVTGGLELALYCDVLIASEQARFADTHARWSLTPVWGMSQRLPRRVGIAKAQEMTYTARTYTGREAVGMGLANWCVPDDQFDAEIEKFARTILANSWFSLRANKRLFLETEGMTLKAGLSYEIHRTEGRGPDMQERIAGFKNKTSKVS